MYVLEQTHGEDLIRLDFQDWNVDYIRKEVDRLIDDLKSGQIDSFTVRWVKDE